MHPKAVKGNKDEVGAPMPGTVIGKFFSFMKRKSRLKLHFSSLHSDIRVKEGDHVEKGQPLVVLSAMKMEMVVQAPRAGTIKKLEIANGMKLEGEDLLLTME